MKRARCHKTAHNWKMGRNGVREKCTLCGDKFPCKSDCCHIDCLEAKHQELPDWIRAVEVSQ